MIRGSQAGQPLHGSTVQLDGAASPSAPSSGLVRAGGRPVEVVAFEEAVISFFLESAMLVGVPKSVAAIYGICFASPGALSFSDIQERLTLSAGSISQGLRVLREVGALKVWNADQRTESKAQRSSAAFDPVSLVAGPRAVRYAPDLELRKLVLHWLEQRLQKQLRSGRDRLELILNAVPNHGTEAKELLSDRLGALRTWHAKAAALVPVAKGFLKLT